MAGFIFGAEGLPKTPQELARMREIAKAMQKRRSPKNVGEGLVALGEGVASGLIMRQANNAERKGREGAISGAKQSILNAMQGLGGSTEPSYSPAEGGVSYSGNIPTEDLETDMPTRRVNQAFSAFGDSMSPAEANLANTSQAGTSTGWLKYSNQGAIRSQPVSDDLVGALSFLPEMGVSMEVFSGGQHPHGSGHKRVGSTRHDHGNAADAFFYKDGRRLDWSNPDDLPIFEEIVSRGRAAGLTGFGAGEGYMRPGSMHLGFGNEAVWGAEGKGVNAPVWLQNAYNSPITTPVTPRSPSNQVASINPTATPQQIAADPKAVLTKKLVEMREQGAAATPVAGQAREPSRGVQRVAQAMPAIDDVALDLATWKDNPFLPPEYRAQVNMVLDAYMNAKDPVRKLQMQKMQAELRRMENPPLPDSVRALDERAQRAGLQRGTEKYNEFMLSGGKSGVTVNVGGGPELGKLSTDYGYILDPETKEPVIDKKTGLPTAAPVPGSLAAQKQETAQQKDERRTSQALVSTRVVSSAAQRARDAAGQRDFGPYGQSLVQHLPWTDSAEVSRQVEVLKSNAKIENLQAMRAASPTGGALGNVSNYESAMLAAKAGALDPSSPNFLRDLDDYELTLLQVTHGLEAGQQIFNSSRQQFGQGQGESGGLIISNIGSMSLEELGTLDMNNLSPEEIDAAEARWNEIMGAR